MGVYRKTTLKRKIPYIIAYTCENCGSQNHFLQYTTVETSYDDRGLFPNMEKRDEAAKKRIEDETLNQINRIMEKKEYQSLNLDCKCEKCGERPRWSLPKGIAYKLIDLAGTIGLFLSVLLIPIMGLVLVENGNPSSILKVFVICIIIGVIMIVFERNRDKKIKNLIETTDPKYQPVILPVYDVMKKTQSLEEQNEKN